MLFTKTIKQEVKVKSVQLTVFPRHIDEEEDFVPLMNGSQFNAIIDLETKKIRFWPEGEEREYYWKICDSGSYFLLGEDDEIIASIIDNYVPNKLLPGDWGDYLDLKIDSKGLITNFPESPALTEFYGDEDE